MSAQSESSQIISRNLTDEAMPADISERTRKVVNAVMAVQQLEQQLPLLDNINQIEELRVNTMIVADWAKRHTDPLGSNGPDRELYDWKQSVTELYNWAIRVGMMCQRRVGQLLGQYRNSGGRPPKKTSPALGKVSSPPKPSIKETGLSHRYVDDAKVLAATSDSDIDTEFDNQSKGGGIIRKSEALRNFRSNKVAHKAKSSDTQSAKTDPLPANPCQEPAPGGFKRNSPSDKFRRYWFKEKKLLSEFFETAELELVGEYWWREFNSFKAHEEKILADSRQDRERRKALKELAKP